MNRNIEKKKGGDNTMALDTLYTKEDIIRRYNIVRGTLDNWVSQGKIPYLKIGKKVLFPSRDLCRWEKERFKPVMMSQNEQK